MNELYGFVAQLVRAPPCHGGGRGFEPLRSRHIKSQYYGRLAQLGEHLPYKQRVIGSSPITTTIYARVAELADAQDLKSCGVKPVPVRFRSRA